MEGFTATSIDGEFYTHRKIWTSALHIHAYAKTAAGGADAFFMAAMLLARLTVEAYCNFVIDVLDPEVFKAEKQHFGSDTSAKVRWIAKRSGFKLGKMRAYQTFRKLDCFRDRIVHAKPDAYGRVTLHLQATEVPFMEQREFEKAISPKICAVAMAHLAELCESMHSQVLGIADKDQRSRLEPSALTGVIHRQIFRKRHFVVLGSSRSDKK